VYAYAIQINQGLGNSARARGRRLKGPQLVTLEEFNQWSGESGMGFVTTQRNKTLAIPQSLESSHVMIMGDTGGGKAFCNGEC
jgi:hypothetical protein